MPYDVRSRVLFVFVLVVLASTGAGLAGEPSAFETMASRYEAVRQALLNDRLEGVAENAAHIARLAADLEASTDRSAPGVPDDGAAGLRALLPSLRESAEAVAVARTLEGAREAFGTLSRALVQYRQMTGSARPAVAFCSMAQKVWLQPEGEIGNPYYGQSMARCGEFVSE